MRRGEFQHLADPLIGTGGHGHTFPGASAPFGMVQLSPDTRVEGWDACAGYHYSDSTILGFSHTHLSGTGIPDYGDFLFTPVSGETNLQAAMQSAHSSRFTHRKETARPGYYSVFLDDYSVTAELTATTRVGVHRYSFAEGDIPNIIVNLLHGLGPDRVIDSQIEVRGDSELSGSRRSSGWAKDQQVFFHAAFSKPFSSVALFSNNQLQRKSRSLHGTDLKCVVTFDPDDLNVVTVKVGISFVSPEGARRNLEAEVPEWDFDTIRERAEKEWARELGKIEIQGGTDKQRRTFYSALYHTMLSPNVSSDVDGSYRQMDGRITKAVDFTPYSVFSLWDTFRAEHPLLSIIDRKRTRDFVRSLLAKYDQSGVLPVWELASNETWTMIGYHSVPVIVDSYVKGIGGIDPEHAYRAMRHSAMMDHQGLRSYREFGYIPADHDGESVSKTLEYAYDDWCIGRMAELLGYHDEAEDLFQRAQYYKNLYDPVSGFMRPKSNSTWVEPFDPASVTFHYTEANPWQYSFFAVQDIAGLIRLMGGNARFVLKLDSLFLANSTLKGRNQPDITGLIGQYAHGNEPSHHTAYLYNYAGAPSKTQHFARLIMDSLYSSRPDGLPGNEDCGQMSAWYVMSALGFYQVCPGDPMYTIGSPLFERTLIHLENGREFVIQADGNSARNRFIQSASLNDNPLTSPFFSHEQLLEGGTLLFAMGSETTTHWAGSVPAQKTMPGRSLVSIPSVHAGQHQFVDSLRLTLSSPEPEATIRFTLDGTEPGPDSPLYQEPLVLRKSTELRATSISAEGSSSKSTLARFVRHVPIGSITLATKYSQQYTGGGDGALLDTRRGGADWRLGAWQGYEGDDLAAVVDFGKSRAIRKVSLGCLQDENSWIFFPLEVEYSVSDDNQQFDQTVVVRNAVSPRESGALVREFTASFEHTSARYLRVRARNLGMCPDWHKGKGGKAWLFVDELMIE